MKEPVSILKNKTIRIETDDNRKIFITTTANTFNIEQGITAQTAGYKIDTTIKISISLLNKILKNPLTVADLFFDTNFETNSPIHAAALFNQLFPNSIDKIIANKFSNLTFKSKNTAAFFEENLPLKLKEETFMENINAIINFEIEGYRNFHINTNTKPIKLINELNSNSNCIIAAKLKDLDKLFNNPKVLFDLLIQQKLKLSNPCRANQFLMACWGKRIINALSDFDKRKIFISKAEENKGKLHFTYQQKMNGEVAKLNFIDVDGLAIIEGDIVIGKTKNLLAIKKQYENTPENAKSGVRIYQFGDPDKFLWKNNTVNYVISPDLKNPSRVAAAIALFKNTNINFVEGSATNYVTIINGDQCKAYMGMQPTPQFLWLTEDCSIGSIAHEFGHTLGLWHEQQRYDRDNFVTINYENMESPEVNRVWFDNVKDYSQDVGAYDYSSIMHYHKYAFGKVYYTEETKKQPSVKKYKVTITTKGSEEIGLREKLSNGDISTLNTRYPN